MSTDDERSGGATDGEEGRAGERTALAWRRTALAVGVVAVLTARLAADAAPGPVAPLLAAAALLGVLPVVALAYRRNSATRRGTPAGRGLSVCVSAGVAYALLGVFLVLLGRR